MKDPVPREEPANDHGAPNEPRLEEVAHSSSRKLLILLAAGLAIIVLAHFTPMGERVRDWNAISALVDDGGIEAAVYFVVLTAALMAIGTPRLLFYTLGGFAFGFAAGLLLSVCGSLIGSFLMFRAARWGGRTWLVARFGARPAFRRVSETRPTALAVALVRMLPISNALINVGLSLSRVGNGAFLAGTALGFLPQGVIATLVGAGIADGAFGEVGVPLAISGAILLVILVWASRRMRAGKTTSTARLDSSRFWLTVIGALCVLIFLIRITGPTDLEGWAQHRNVGYVMDMMWQGNWIVQHDIQGRILSKPPLHTWAIAPFAALFGVDRLAMTLPSFLAVLALSLLVFFEGRRRFGVMAGGLAALSVVLAPMFSKHIALVRSDPLFALAITVGAFAAFRAWETGRGWTLFWFAGAMATLTKGPLGLILAAAGLLAHVWEKRTDRAASPPRGSQLSGIVVFLTVTLSWFVLALRDQGFDLIDKMFFDELVGQAVGVRKDGFPGENLPKPTLFLLLRFLPFSIFFFYGLWRVFREPAADPHERRFERFLAVWVLTGLVIFSLAAHHRADLLLPLWPACALLAGRELVRLAQRVGIATFSTGLAMTCGVLVAGIYAHYHVTFSKRAENTEHAVQVRLAAEAIAAQGIDPLRLHHSGTPVTLQMYLGTFRPWLSPRDIKLLLGSGQPPIYLAVESRGMKVIESLPGTVRAEVIFEWIKNDSGEPLIRIYRLSP